MEPVCLWKHACKLNNNNRSGWVPAGTRVGLTWGAEHVEDEAGQHEGQDGPVVAEVAVAELLPSVPYGGHLHQAQGDLLQQGHHLRLLVRQLHLEVHGGREGDIQRRLSQRETDIYRVSE